MTIVCVYILCTIGLSREDALFPITECVCRFIFGTASGANMVTFANEDQSFEFHVQLEQVRQIAFVEKETPKKTLRIVRLVNTDGATMTSLILVDTSDEAQQWFSDMIQRHGSVIQL